MTSTTQPTNAPEPETHVDDPDGPTMVCPYCERPFPDGRTGALHVGEVHADRCSDAERRQYEQALESEADDLFVYHLKIVGALSLLYSLSVLGYMVVLGAG